MTAVCLLLSALALLALLALGVSFFFYRFACARSFRPKKSVGGSPLAPYKAEMAAERARFLAGEPEQVEIVSRDGLRLRGLYYSNGESRRSVLLVHGYRAAHGGMTDFSIVLPFYIELGLNILLIDQRAHGESEGETIAFGALERYDCADWAAWLDTRMGGRGEIVLDGISMGAATVLLASDLPLPASVRGIVADCGYSNPYTQLRHVARDMLHLPIWPVLPLIRFWARALGGFELRVSAADSLRRNTALPVLFVHGDADGFVPCAASRENYAACAAPKELVIVEGAAHGLSYLVDRPRCQAKLREFFRSVFTAQSLPGTGADPLKPPADIPAVTGVL